jgi:glutamine synthetase
VRVVGGRIEYRAPDASCNPYLTHAVIAAAVRDGIENHLLPGPPLAAEDKPPAPSFAELPTTLGEALQALREDRVVCSAMTEELLDTFVQLKRDEWERACGAVTDWHREMYLHYVP